MRFPSHTPDTAAGKAADLLADIIERHGSAGTMVRKVSAVSLDMALPIAVWESSVGVYMIVKGFRTPPAEIEPTVVPDMPAPALAEV